MSASLDVVAALRGAQIFRRADVVPYREMWRAGSGTAREVAGAVIGDCETEPEVSQFVQVLLVSLVGTVVVTIAPYTAGNPVASMFDPIEDDTLRVAAEAVERARVAGVEPRVGAGPWWTTDAGEHVPLWCAPREWLLDLWGWLDDQMHRPPPPVGAEPELPWQAPWMAAIDRELARRGDAEPEGVLWQ